MVCRLIIWVSVDGLSLVSLESSDLNLRLDPNSFNISRACCFMLYMVSFLVIVEHSSEVSIWRWYIWEIVEYGVNHFFKFLCIAIRSSFLLDYLSAFIEFVFGGFFWKILVYECLLSFFKSWSYWAFWHSLIDFSHVLGYAGNNNTVKVCVLAVASFLWYLRYL